MNLKARLRPRLLGSAVTACLIFAVLPTSWAVNSRLPVAWVSGVVCYLTLAQTILAFLFKTTILALAVNVGAGLL